MENKDYILAIDQGTTSTRVIAFDHKMTVLGSEQIELKQYYPDDGWVEHDASEIWLATVTVLSKLEEKMKAAGYTAISIGITNQRETTVVWDRNTGEPVHKAIVWQDRRTADYCNRIRSEEPWITQQTGLVLDPYFSATKLRWILQSDDTLLRRAHTGELCFGTIESYLLFRLTGGGSHKTDLTNASRTMLCDIRTGTWSDDLLNLMGIPKAVLPAITDNVGKFGQVTAGLPYAGLMINGMVGDQQSAAIGQACLSAGAMKSTYGTGCFVLVNTGHDLVRSDHKLLSTVAYSEGGVISYALEGSIFNAGTVVQWFRDELNFIENAPECEALAKSVDSTGGVMMVPAFTGLGAPHWDPNARGVISGLTRDSNKAHIVRAGLSSIAYQTADLIAAIRSDFGGEISFMRVDGGMAANDWMMQFLSDMCDVPVSRPTMLETTALGAALCAAVGSGAVRSLADTQDLWGKDRDFNPAITLEIRGDHLGRWQQALKNCLTT